MNVTSTGIAVALAIVVVLGFFVFGLSNPFGMTAETVPQQQQLGAAPTTTNEAGLMITEVQLGTGALATPGSTVSVHYTGTLEDGTVFDASAPRGEPITFMLGAGQVIKGWDQGIEGMKVGGKRHLVIPSDLAYGDRAVGNVIPANATLVFDVELVAVQ